jgi:hypothetical protein
VSARGVSGFFRDTWDMLSVRNRKKWTNTLENRAVEALNYQVDTGVLRMYRVVLEHKVEK